MGGYLGALLLGSTYLALGLCISALTRIQVVSLFVTLIVGGLMYAIGSDPVLRLFDTGTAEILQSLGTGSRFDSIERGVLDLRDLTYYIGLTTFFLVLNGMFLEWTRIDRASESGRVRFGNHLLTLTLVAANVIAANVWLAPIHSLRVDLTETGEYSISGATQNVLTQLDEPLLIQGIFSEKTHPKLAPLVPRVRDFLREYEVRGAGRVAIDIIDPTTDEDFEKELNDELGIRPFPFRVMGRNEQSVVNSYFHILINYGDKREALSFQDLIDVQQTAEGDIDVRLRNLEYDVTRTIKRVSQEFQSLDAIFAKMDEGKPAQLTAYLSPGSLPEDLKQVSEHIRTIGAEFQKQSGGKLVFAEKDPSQDQALAQDLYDNYGIQPFAADLFGRQVFYFQVVLVAGEKLQTITPQGDMSEGELRNTLEAAIKRATPGNLKTVAVLTEKPVAPPRNPNLPPQMQPPPPRPDFQILQQTFRTDYEILTVDGATGEIPAEVDVLIVGKAGKLDDKQKFAIDQYLMRGGRVIALAGHYKVSVSQEGLDSAKVDPSLFELLETWGVNVEDALILDTQNAPFPRLVREGPFARLKLQPYPFFSDIRPDGFRTGHAAVAGLVNVVAPWASPVSVKADLEGIDSEVLLETSPASWLRTTGSIELDKVISPTGDQERRTVAVTLGGKFQSHFADKASPLWGEGSGADADRTGRTLKESLPDARLAVIGSSELVSDLLLTLGGEVQQLRGAPQLVQNLVDWSTEDTDLLTIRSGGAFARTLMPMEEDERWKYEIASYLIVLLGLLGFLIVPRVRRRAVQPLI